MQENQFKISKGLKVRRGLVAKQKITNLTPKKKKRKK